MLVSLSELRLEEASGSIGSATHVLENLDGAGPKECEPEDSFPRIHKLADARVEAK
jgi:hypothetical protein